MGRAVKAELVRKIKRPLDLLLRTALHPGLGEES
jgi:hypothetical protein